MPASGIYFPNRKIDYPGFPENKLLYQRFKHKTALAYPLKIPT